MPQSSSSQQELQSLADYLKKIQDVILHEWEDEMKQDKRTSIELNFLSREKFQNHIPTFLDQFNNKLRDEEALSEITAKRHGANRWEYGLDLQETMKEWGILHKVLMKQINESQEAISLSLASFKKAQMLLAEHIHKGIIFSVIEYGELQELEADAQLRDLRQAFKSPEKFSQSEELRQTSHDIKGIAHILRTGFNLLEDEKISEKAAGIIDQMSTAADSLNQLLNDLLDLFRLEAGKEKVNKKNFDAASLLRELCKSNQPLAEAEGLELRCKGDEKIAVRSDPKKVKRIAQNLLLNSLKYTRSGFVEVEWKLKQEDYWMMRICDTGPGLGATHAASLTTESDTSESPERSQKGDSSNTNKSSAVQNHGEGIGLLIVRQLCELLKAVIEVETEKNKGTTYRIVFPVDVSQ